MSLCRRRFLPFLPAVGLIALLLGLPGLTSAVDQGGQRGEPKQLKLAPQGVWDQGFSEAVTAAAFDPTNRPMPLVAVGSYGEVRLFSLADRSEVTRLTEPAGYFRSLAYSPDGQWLVGGGYQQVVIWNNQTLKREQVLKGHRGYITGIAFTDEPGQFVTASDDESVRLWQVGRDEPLAVWRDFRFPVNGVAYCRSTQRIVVATGDPSRPTKKGEVLVLTPQGETVARLEGHGRAALGVTVSEDGQRLASVGLDETLRVWNAQTGESLGVCEGHDRPVNGAVFVRKGQFLDSVGGGRSTGGNDLKVWRSKDYADLGTLAAHRAPINGVVVSPNGEALLTYSVDKSWKLWKTADLLKATGDSSALTIADLLLPPGLKLPAAKSDQPAAATPATPTPAAGAPAEVAPAASKPVPQSIPAERPEAPALPDGASFAALGATAVAVAPQDQAEGATKVIRVGIIGLDTSHATAFTQILNDPNAKDDVARCKVVAAYPKGSPDIPSSTSRVPSYTEEVKKHGVEIVDSIEALVAKVDAVLLETNDGRPHLEQILPVLKAGKPVFIDKPIAGSLTDAVAIFEAAKHYKVPVFSSSSLRYSSGAQAIRRGETVGEVRGCDAYSPCSLEATHPELFWYGIHGVETLFTVMGEGCESVSRSSTPGIDLAVGVWKGGRVGTFRGIRSDAGGGSAGYGGTAFGTKSIAPIGSYEGYRPLLVTIVQFFRDGKVPIAESETLEIYAFMEAADESKRQAGAPVKLATVLEKARAEATKKLQPLLK